MSRRKTARILIGTAFGVQLAGLIVDIVWHALHSDFAAATTEQMLVHLGTVHMPIYVGVVCVVLTTAWALIDQARRPPIGAAFPVAFVGALISASNFLPAASRGGEATIACRPMAAGSRPAASACRRMVSMQWRALSASASWLPSQPSPSSPTRRSARSERPPIQIGRRLPCGGLGSMPIAVIG